jgi:alkylhydroperoxidase family enzyme
MKRTPTRTASPEAFHGVAAWRESPFFDDAQRVALAFTEALTAGIEPIGDEVWDEAGRRLGQRGRADLLLAVGAINTLNMSGITTRLQPQP